VLHNVLQNVLQRAQLKLGMRWVIGCAAFEGVATRCSHQASARDAPIRRRHGRVGAQPVLTCWYGMENERAEL